MIVQIYDGPAEPIGCCEDAFDWEDRMPKPPPPRRVVFVQRPLYDRRRR